MAEVEADHNVTLKHKYSRDVERFTYDSASHQAIIVKSYVIVRLSLDCRTMSYDFTDITDSSQHHRFQYDNKNTIVIS